MKTVTFTDFRNNASSLITQVEHGETLLLFRHGKPVAEIVPFSDESRSVPTWKRPGIGLRARGSDLSSAILDERESGP
jgi:prevent-host-death family protein